MEKKVEQTQVIDVLGTTFEEDIESAFDVCVKYFGPVGRFLYKNKKGFSNAVVTTKKHGKLWYGDLSNEDFDLLTSIQQEIGSEILVMPMN